MIVGLGIGFWVRGELARLGALEFEWWRSKEGTAQLVVALAWWGHADVTRVHWHGKGVAWIVEMEVIRVGARGGGMP